MYKVCAFDPRKKPSAVNVRPFDSYEEVSKYTTDPAVLYRVHRFQAQGISSVSLIGRPVYGVWYKDNKNWQEGALRWWNTWDADRSIREGLLTEDQLFVQQMEIAKLEIEHLHMQNNIFKQIEELSIQTGVRMDIFQTIPNVEDFAKLYIFPTNALFDLWNLGDADWNGSMRRLICDQAHFIYCLRKVANPYNTLIPGRMTEKGLMEFSKMVSNNGFDIIQMAHISSKITLYSAKNFLGEAREIEANINNFLVRAIKRGDKKTFARLVPILIEAVEKYEFILPNEFSHLSESFDDAADIFEQSQESWDALGWTEEMFEPLLLRAWKINGPPRDIDLTCDEVLQHDSDAECTDDDPAPPKRSCDIEKELLDDIAREINERERPTSPFAQLTKDLNKYWGPDAPPLPRDLLTSTKPSAKPSASTKPSVKDLLTSTAPTPVKDLLTSAKPSASTAPTPAKDLLTSTAPTPAKDLLTSTAPTPAKDLLTSTAPTPETPSLGEKLSRFTKRRREYAAAEQNAIAAKNLMDEAAQDLDSDLPPNKRGKFDWYKLRMAPERMELVPSDPGSWEEHERNHVI
jgi:hypothetical protein